MSEGGVRGLDLFKIAGESISGWIPSFKTGDIRPTRQPFCSQMEEQLLLHLEYHPLVTWYGRGDMNATFASTYKIPSPLPIPFTINYLFESKAHVYLPDAIGQLLDGGIPEQLGDGKPATEFPLYSRHQSYREDRISA